MTQACQTLINRGEGVALGAGLLEGRTPCCVTTTYTHEGGAPDPGSFSFKLLPRHRPGSRARPQAPGKWTS